MKPEDLMDEEELKGVLNIDTKLMMTQEEQKDTLKD